MGLVHDVVAGFERVVDVRGATGAPRGSMHPPPAGEVRLRDEREPRLGEDHAPVDRRDGHADHPGRDGVDDGLDSVLGEHLGEAVS